MNRDVKLYEKVIVNEISKFMDKNDIADVIDISRSRFEELLRMKKLKNKNFDIEEIFENYTDNIELRNALIDFSQMRVEIKKPLLTKNATTRLLNKLDRICKNDKEKIATLEKSIINNWQDIWENKEDERISKGKIVKSIDVNDIYKDSSFGNIEKRVLSKNKMDRYIEEARREIGGSKYKQVSDTKPVCNSKQDGNI